MFGFHMYDIFVIDSLMPQFVLVVVKDGLTFKI
jgi:hypothetical protein